MMSDSSSLAVATMTGAAVIARIIFSAWPPSRSGSPRSRTITSGGSWLTSLIPSSAVPAVRTACDRLVRSAAIAERTYGSSSTMSTRAMFRTVRIRRVACCIIADMVRIMAAFAAWAAGTAVAVSVTWFGANVVIRNAGVGPGMPVINAAVLPTPAAASAAAGPAAGAPSAQLPPGGDVAGGASARPRPRAASPASPSASARRPPSASPSAVRVPVGLARRRPGACVPTRWPAAASRSR